MEFSLIFSAVTREIFNINKSGNAACHADEEI